MTTSRRRKRSREGPSITRVLRDRISQLETQVAILRGSENQYKSIIEGAREALGSIRPNRYLSPGEIRRNDPPSLMELVGFAIGRRTCGNHDVDVADIVSRATGHWPPPAPKEIVSDVTNLFNK